MTVHGHPHAALIHEQYAPYLDDLSSSDDGHDKGMLYLEKFPASNIWSSPFEAPYHYVRSIPWRGIILRCLNFFLPSFLQGRHSRERIRSTTLHPTAYLDGMRGMAALFVFFCHYFYQAFLIAESWGCRDRNWNLFKLPIIRLFYQGPAAVCLFFVISGYALSYRPLKMIRSSSTNDFSTTMSSLVFRRGIRLFLPSIISTFMIFCLISLGAYDLTKDFAHNRTYLKNVAEPHPERLETIQAQFWEWVWSVYKFVHVFSWNPQGGRIDYDVHLWTIPIEYRCSLFLFLALIGTARITARLRFLTIGLIMAFVYRSSRWDLLLFLAGMLIAELDLIRGAHNITTTLPHDQFQQSNKQSESKPGVIIWICMSILGLFLMSQPDANGHETPGWVYLCSLVPPWWDAEGYRYWQSFGAIVFVIAVGHSNLWQQVFNSRPVQYFGRISYALYLMHGPAMHVLGYHFEEWAYGLTGVEGYWFNAGFALHACLCIPMVIWVSDIFWRVVDVPTVKFAKWLERACLA